MRSLCCRYPGHVGVQRIGRLRDRVRHRGSDARIWGHCSATPRFGRAVRRVRAGRLQSALLHRWLIRYPKYKCRRFGTGHLAAPGNLVRSCRWLIRRAWCCRSLRSHGDRRGVHHMVMVGRPGRPVFRRGHPESLSPGGRPCRDGFVTGPSRRHSVVARTCDVHGQALQTFQTPSTLLRVSATSSFCWGVPVL